MQCTVGSGAKPLEAWGVFENFCVKSNLREVTLQSVRLLLAVSYRKIGETGCTTCRVLLPPNDFEPPVVAPPVPASMLASSCRGRRSTNAGLAQWRI